MFETIRGHTIYTPPLNSGAMILDLGANRGDFAREMKARYGGRGYLVEANPDLAAQLRRDGSFPVIHGAVAASDGTVRFNVAENDEGSSVLDLPKTSSYQCTLRRTVDVPARTLESIVAETGAGRIDVLKIDIEGAEVDVLDRVPAEVLSAVGQITIEFHCDPMFGFNLREGVERVIRRLRGLGFLCLDFSHRTRVDVLFINTRLCRVPWLTRAAWRMREDRPGFLVWLWRACPAAVRSRLRRRVCPS